MKKLSIAMLVLVSIALTGCDIFGFIDGSGYVVSQSLYLSNFDEVHVSDAIEVSIVESTNYGVVLTTDDNLMEYVHVYRQGDELRVEIEDGYNLNATELSVYVSLPALYELSATDACEVELKSVSTSGSLWMVVSDAAELRATNLSVTGTLSLQADDAAEVWIQGSGGSLELDVNDASEADLLSYTVQNANARVSNASEATVRTTSSLNCWVRNASTLGYAGSGSVDIRELSIGSSIMRINN